MALPSRYGIDKKINSMEGLSAYENGGKGSGNFGHAGRPGMIGGSGDGGTYYGSKSDDELKSIEKDVLSQIQKLEKAKEHVTDHHRYGSKEYDAEKEDIQYELDSLNDQHEEVKAEIKKRGQSSKGGEVSLKGKSLYEKVHMIQPGDEVHITPKDNLPNFDRKIKVDYIQDGTIHYGSSETSDGYTYPAWAIKDITKIVRKKKNELELNGGKGSGNWGHAGRPGEIGGSGSGKTQLQRATEAEATSGKVGHFAGLEYVDEIYKEKSKKIKDDLTRLKEVKDRDGFVDANDPAHARLDKLKEQIARAKELVGSDVPQAQRTKIEKLEKLVGKIEDITGWKNSIGRTFNGGKGSGNFGHAGRPGEVGGSGSGKGGASREDLEREMEDASRAVMDYDDLLAEEESFGGDTSQLESARQEALDKFNEARRKLEEYDAKKEKDNIPSEIKRFEKALTDYANGDDIISIMTHKDEWEKFEKWAKKERYTKDEWEKLLASPEFGKYARDVADL